MTPVKRFLMFLSAPEDTAGSTRIQTGRKIYLIWQRVSIFNAVQGSGERELCFEINSFSCLSGL